MAILPLNGRVQLMDLRRSAAAFRLVLLLFVLLSIVPDMGAGF